MRWMLGVFEAGLFPGVNYYLSWSVWGFHMVTDTDCKGTSWYKRSEFGIRAAIFFTAASVSGAFGGLLAVGSVSVYGAHRFNDSAGGDCQAGRGWRQTWVVMDL